MTSRRRLTWSPNVGPKTAPLSSRTGDAASPTAGPTAGSTAGPTAGSTATPQPHEDDVGLLEKMFNSGTEWARVTFKVKIHRWIVSLVLGYFTIQSIYKILIFFEKDVSGVALLYIFWYTIIFILFIVLPVKSNVNV
jgi:hypothetical protein